MDRRKQFTILLTVGILLLLTPVVVNFLMPAQAYIGLSLAEYFPVQDTTTGKWGFIDRTGKPITPMVFDWAGDFRDGRGLAESHGNVGYIDADFEKTGDWAITPRFALRHSGDLPAHGFFQGLALAREDDGRWGYIDTAGAWAIAPQFMEFEDYPGVPAGDFADGLAWFQVVEMAERYKVDTDGKMVRDEAGKPVMEPYPRRRFGYIDRDGEVVIEPRFEMAQDFGQGLAAVRIKTHDNWGFIDCAGKTVLSPKYEQVDRFSEGLCAVSEDGLWGYINAKGKWVIEPRFAEARQFSEGLAAAREGQQWGYINPDGQWVIPPAFDDFEVFGHPGEPHAFENGLAQVTLKGQRIYINTQAQRIWPSE